MKLFAFVLMLTTSAAWAEGAVPSWDKIGAVFGHPRCTNCHVGDQDTPMWEGLRFGPGTRHGMGIRADESRIGADSQPCRSCHVTSSRANVTPHAPPHVREPWQLPPISMGWLNKSSADICAHISTVIAQDEGIEGLVSHVTTSAFVAYGLNPGAGRSAPGPTPHELAQNLRIWHFEGGLCPE